MLEILKAQLQSILATLKLMESTDANRIKLYETALACLGIDASPSDAAPDEFGCADTVNEIYRKAFGGHFYEGNHLSTYYLYKALRSSFLFREVHIPVPGDIVISPTGFGTRKNPDGSLAIPNGHVGYVMTDGKIASNDSRTGKFEINYTTNSWADRYVRRGGYFVKYYRRV